MKPYKITTPIWNGGNRCVGIADFRLKSSDALIEITYKDEQGNRIYPHKYFMNRIKAKQYPIQTYKGINLHIIPIDHFEVRESSIF